MNKFYKGFCIFFIYILFINVLSFKSKIFGLGIGTIITYVFTLFFLMVTIIFSTKLKTNWLIFAGFSSFSVILILKLYINNPRGAGVIDLLGTREAWLTFLIYFLCSALFLKNAKDKMKMVRWIGYIFISSSIIGIIHYYFFYNFPFMDNSYASNGANIILNVANYNLMRFRESSIFFGPNVNAFMTVLGYLFLIFSYLPFGLKDMFKSPLYWFGLIVHCWNIIISDSRSGVLLIVIFTIALFYDKKLWLNFHIDSKYANYKYKFSKYKFLITLSALMGLIIYINYEPRFSPKILFSDPRILKFTVGLFILFSSLSNALIGAPLNDKWEIGNIQVSDNMYIAILLNVGFIGFLILVYTFILVFRSLKRRLVSGIDYHFTLFAKYALLLFLISGFFSITSSILPYMIFLGIILGGVKWSDGKISS